MKLKSEQAYCSPAGRGDSCVYNDRALGMLPTDCGFELN